MIKRTFRPLALALFITLTASSTMGAIAQSSGSGGSTSKAGSVTPSGVTGTDPVPPLPGPQPPKQLPMSELAAALLLYLGLG